jgi:hypothetical protein
VNFSGIKNNEKILLVLRNTNVNMETFFKLVKNIQIIPGKKLGFPWFLHFHFFSVAVVPQS